jgi:hypothetical protein
MIHTEKESSQTEEDKGLITFDLCPACNNVRMAHEESCPICGFDLF